MNSFTTFISQSLKGLTKHGFQPPISHKESKTPATHTPFKSTPKERSHKVVLLQTTYPPKMDLLPFPTINVSLFFKCATSFLISFHKATPFLPLISRVNEPSSFFLPILEAITVFQRVLFFVAYLQLHLQRGPYLALRSF